MTTANSVAVKAVFDSEQGTTQEETKVKERKTKLKPPTKPQRVESVRDRISRLPDELVADGFGEFLSPPTAITLMEEPDFDPKTGGHIGKVKEPLGTYIQRVSVSDNISQRPPFDHAEDSIYRRLIRDFIEGAAMPESKVAALGTSGNEKITSLDAADNIRFSVIDGLQRLYCFCLALLLVLKRESLVSDGIIKQEAWNFFAEAVEKTGDAREATKRLLQREIRFEVFYDIDLGGLLHYMVTFNTGQRRMNLSVQLEIMEQPLIRELEHHAGISVYYDQQRIPGSQKPKDKFAASDLVLATKAFVSNNAQVTATHEAERFLNEDKYLDNVGDITDVVQTLKRIGIIHAKMGRIYAGDMDKRYILSSGLIFLIGLSAACGYVRNSGNMKMLEGAFDKLDDLLAETGEDPLDLEEYFDAGRQITSSRGKTMRRLVDDTFRRFFSGATKKLEWLDTARQITSTVV